MLGDLIGDAAAPDAARNRLLSLALRPAPVTDQWVAEGPSLGDLGMAAAGMTLIEADSPAAEAGALAVLIRDAVHRGEEVTLISAERGLTRRVAAALDRWGIIPDMSGVQALSELVGIDVAKQLTMTADKITGTRADELGLATEVADDPVAAALALAERLATRSPDALAATKRLFDGTWHRSPRHTFARERREQLPLLFGPNAARARAANARKAEPEFLPRQRRLVP